MICSAAMCNATEMAVSDQNDLDTPGGRLAWAREKAGFVDRASFARAVGVVPTTYRAYENNQNGYAKLAPKFAKKLGVTTDWLLTGGSLPDVAIAVAEPRSDFAPTVSASDGETAEIGSLDLSFSMGPGATVDDYIEETPVRFDLGFIRQITRTAPNRLRLAHGVGDSMFPTIHSSDRVMIDTTQRTLNLNDRIWAVSIHGAAAIKRLRPIGGGRVLVVSDNPAVDNYEVDAQDMIIGGRIIWLSRDV